MCVLSALANELVGVNNVLLSLLCVILSVLIVRISCGGVKLNIASIASALCVSLVDTCSLRYPWACGDVNMDVCGTCGETL